VGLYDGFRISVSGMDAQARRLRLIASNLANARSTRSVDGRIYRRKDLLFAAVPVGQERGVWTGENEGQNRVVTVGVVEDPGPLKRVYMPEHPDADKDGFVLFPNVEPFEEMVHMVDALRSYEANIASFNASKEMMKKALELGR
jgi:flagellar basal-body rod protein FlgC